MQQTMTYKMFTILKFLIPGKATTKVLIQTTVTLGFMIDTIEFLLCSQLKSLASVT